MSFTRAVMLIMALTVCAAGWCQDPEERLQEAAEGMNLPSVVKPVFKGYTHFVDEAGDTCIMVYFNDIVVYPRLHFKNKKEEEKYWRLVRDVKRTLPYARLIGETLVETYEYMETFADQRERQQYMKRMEKEVYRQYKPILKRFTRTQARILTKLIRRETNQSGYDIVKAFLGTGRAFFYQTFGRLFGVNLNASYKPLTNRDDALIERIATQVEQGQL